MQVFTAIFVKKYKENCIEEIMFCSAIRGVYSQWVCVK